MIRCRRCGAENPNRARFCSACGVALAEPGELFEERKLVSVLFVDVVGSTAAADEADPEDIRERLRVFYERVRGQIDRFGGTTEKFIGDAVVAIFGAPTARDDDAERAVRCGLGVIEAVAELDRERPELALAVRAAVETGEAVVALGAAFERGEALATGDVVNIVARLQSSAPTGRLVVGEETFKLTRRNVSYEALDPIPVKGKRKPLAAWLTVGVSPTDMDEVSGRVHDSQLAGDATTTPMVGRSSELELASSVWRDVCDRLETRILTFVGPPGIGKSRLSLEIERLVVGAGGSAARGRCLPFGEDAGYGGFAQQLRSLASIRQADPPFVAQEKLSTLTAKLIPGPDAKDVAERLFLLLGLSSDVSVADQQTLFYAARRLIEALGRDRPHLLVFEDLHWADQSLLELVSYLITRVDAAAVLFLVLARPELLERDPGWARGGSDHLVTLSPLTSAESIELAVRLSGDGELSEQLAERAEGNPLFIEELVAARSEGGGPGGSGGLPTTVRATIAGRIDSLPAAARSVLMEASVAGQEFWRGILSQPEGSSVDAALDMLRERDLVRRDPRSHIEGDEQFIFKHALIRDVAYATLPRSVRRVRHAAVAEFIERTAGARVSESAASLGHHWREAGEKERAADAFELAGDTALRGWAKGEAVGLYQQALDLVPLDLRDRRRDLELRESRALIANGDYQRAADLIDELLQRLSGREELEATMDRTKAASWLTDAEGVRRFGRRSAELADALGAPELSAPALGYVSQISSMEGRCSEMIDVGERALRMWPSGYLPAEQAYQLEMVALTQTWVGRYAEAEAHLSESLSLADSGHSVEAMLRAGATMGLALVGQGRHEEALRRFEEAISRGKELELMPRFTARALNMSSSALRDLMQLDEARRRNEEAIELGHQAGFSLAWIQGGIDLLEADLLDGEYARAEQRWPDLWEQTESTQGFHQWLMAGRLLVARSQLDLLLHGADEAAASASRAARHADETERPKQRATARSILGAALIELGRPDEGIAQLRDAISIAATLDHPPSTWRANVSLARACLTVGRDGEADMAWTRAGSAIASLASGLGPELHDRFLETPAIAAMASRM